MSETTLPTTTDLSPSEIDEQLAEIWGQEQKAIQQAAQYRRWAKSYKPESRSAAEYLAEADEADRKALDARHAAHPYEAEFARRGGWSRFFVVNNVGGHVHREMNCSTCFATTSFSWIPSLSGSTEETMVGEYGEMACTVCFPSAPSMSGFGDGTSALARYSAAEKAERAAEKAAKAAAKEAKAIYAPDGSDLVVGPYRDHVRTIIAAERKISEWVQDFVGYGLRDAERGNSHPSSGEWRDGVLTLAEALLARGIPAERIDTIVARAEKKARKEWS